MKLILGGHSDGGSRGCSQLSFLQVESTASYQATCLRTSRGQYELECGFRGCRSANQSQHGDWGSVSSTRRGDCSRACVSNFQYLKFTNWPVSGAIYSLSSLTSWDIAFTPASWIRQLLTPKFTGAGFGISWEGQTKPVSSFHFQGGSILVLQRSWFTACVDLSTKTYVKERILKFSETFSQ